MSVLLLGKFHNPKWLNLDLYDGIGQVVQMEHGKNSYAKHNTIRNEIFFELVVLNKKSKIILLSQVKYNICMFINYYAPFLIFWKHSLGIGICIELGC